MDKTSTLYQEDLDRILHLKGMERLREKCFLITGATGMVGTCLIDALMKFNRESQANVNIIAVGRSRERAVSRLGEYFSSDCFQFLEQDVREAFPDSVRADYIIPLASNTHPMAYSKYPVETIEINVKGAENALKKAVRNGATVLYPSTVEIYGNGEDNFTEDYTGKLNLGTSRACYTESKRVSEALCQSYIAEYGVNCKIVRLSRLFGPTMLESDTKASSQFILKALASEDIVLKSKGNQLFSYTYVADAVQAMLFVLLNGELGQAYNIAGNAVRLREFAYECASLADKSVIFDLPLEVEAKGYSIATKAILSTDKLSKLGWTASYSWREAIKRTYCILSKK
jgi:nucleoside-diphosphate-sugar epimerase